MIIFTLWKQGRLKDILSIYGDKDSVQGEETLLLLAKSEIGLGKFNSAKDTIELIESATLSLDPDHILFSELFSLRAEMARYELNTPLSSTYLNSALRIALRAKDRGALGRVYYQMGMLEFMADNRSSAISLYLKALDYLDVINYPIQTAIIYLYLGRMYEQGLNIELSTNYMHKAIEILRSIDNAYYLAWCYNALGMSQAMSEDYSGAIEQIDLALRASKLSGSDMEMHYSYKYLGIIDLARNKYESAHQNLSLAEEKEKIFRSGVGNSRNQLMKLLVESKGSYNSSISRMKEIVSPQKGLVKPKLGKYLLNTARLIHGDSNEVAQSKMELSRLERSTQGQLNEAVRKTLDTRSLQVIR